MSLLASLAGVARSFIGPSGLAGVAVSFTRTIVGQYDGVSGVSMPSSTLSWSGTAIEVANEQAGTRSTDSLAPTGQRTILRTFKVPGAGLLNAPAAGDVLTVAGVALRVAAVTRVAALDAVTVPLYTVECVA
jgi:hypothetical protein